MRKETFRWSESNAMLKIVEGFPRSQLSCRTYYSYFFLFFSWKIVVLRSSDSIILPTVANIFIKTYFMCIHVHRVPSCILLSVKHDAFDWQSAGNWHRRQAYNLHPSAIRQLHIQNLANKLQEAATSSFFFLLLHKCWRCVLHTILMVRVRPKDPTMHCQKVRSSQLFGFQVFRQRLNWLAADEVEVLKKKKTNQNCIRTEKFSIRELVTYNAISGAETSTNLEHNIFAECNILSSHSFYLCSFALEKCFAQRSRIVWIPELYHHRPTRERASRRY